MNIGNLIERTARRFGVAVVPEWRVASLAAERHLARLLQEFEVDCVFDVGANVGQYGRMLRSVIGYRGRILSFEPNPAALPRLRAAAAGDPEWTVEAFALGPEPGTARFNAYDLSELSSFRQFGGLNGTTRRAAQAIEVPVQTLHAYFREAEARFRFSRPFLKLDTQGYDLEVARGAGDALGAFVGLQSEVAFRTIYEGAPDYRAAIDFYQRAGFVVSQLFPVNDIHFPQLVEMDVVMVRADLLSRPDEPATVS